MPIDNRTAVESSCGFTTERLLELAEQVPEELRGLCFEERLAEDLLILVRTDPAGRQKCLA
ncbi:hypothetical protein ACGFYY_39000 [Streptomyces sp. NPDC048331]|uniref:hypothetical protein n=1 Tax=Streptomyces sp. NPDC048331 TaxID=3365534 RepID=UPI0037242F2D